MKMSSRVSESTKTMLSVSKCREIASLVSTNILAGSLCGRTQRERAWLGWMVELCLGVDSQMKAVEEGGSFARKPAVPFYAWGFERTNRK